MLELRSAVFLRVALGVVVVGGVVDGLVGLAQPKVLLFCCFRKREGSFEISEGERRVSGWLVSCVRCFTSLCGASVTLREMQELRNADVEKWVAYWRRSGVVPE